MPVPPASSARRILCFGVFEADLVSGELRKAGVRIRLQDQPFQLLTLLLEHPQEIVSRDEIRAKLWPADTFVDFDHSLNTAVAKIREVLGDSASSPRYIETLAKRGYRFVAPVQATDGVVGAEEPVAVAARAETDLPMPHRGLSRSLFGLLQIMYLTFYLTALLHLSTIDQIADSILPGSASFALYCMVLVTGGIGIPLRCYLLSGVVFDYRRLGEKFQKLFLAILILDQLWAIAPFLLTYKIGFGAAFAASAALLYVPFSERTLIRMAYPVRP